jgi:hypothetical protein
MLCDVTPFSSAELCYLQHRFGGDDCRFFWTVIELVPYCWMSYQVITFSL